MSNPAEQFNMQTPDWSSLQDLSDTSLDCLMSLSPSAQHTLTQPFTIDFDPFGGFDPSEGDMDEGFGLVTFSPLGGSPSPFFAPPQEIEDLSTGPSLTPPVGLVDSSEQTQVLIDEDLQVCFRCPGCQFWYNKYSRVLKTLTDLVNVELNPGPPKKTKKPKQTKVVKSRIGRLTQINNPTQARAAPGRNPNPRTMSMGLQHLAAYMRCLNDPFNEPPARPGVGCALPTGLFTAYLRQTFTTSGAGTGSFVFIPSRLQNPIVTSGTASAPYSFGTAGISPFPQFSAINALYEKARILAAGVRLIPLQNSTNDQGLVSTALIPGLRTADVINFGQTTTIAATQGFNEYSNYPQTLQSPFKIGATTLWRPQDPNSFVFREAPMSDNVSGIADSLQNQPFMVAGFSGTAASAQFIAEFIVHFEGTIAAGNAGVIDLQRAPPTSELQALKAADLVFGTDNRTTYPGFSDTMISASAKAGRNIGRGGLNKRTLLDSLSDFTSSVAGPLVSGLFSML